MCASDQNESRALQALVDILENALRVGADAIELEYEGSGLQVCYMFGSMGLGSVIVDRDLERGIIATLVERAGLDRRSRGTMRIDLHGEQRVVIVEEYESFGEPAFRLSLAKPRGKRRQ